MKPQLIKKIIEKVKDNNTGKIKNKYFYIFKIKCGSCQKVVNVKKTNLNFRNKKVNVFCSVGCHRKKPITLEFYKTREIAHAPSISQFCKERPWLGKNAKYHFASVLKGERFHYKGWHLVFKKTAILKDLQGNTFKVTNPLLFSKKVRLNKEKNNKITSSGILSLINQKVKIYKGLYLAKNPPEAFLKEDKFKYTFKNKNFDKITSGVKKDISKKINRGHHTINLLIKGIQWETRNGWHLEDIEPIREKKMIIAK